MNEHKYRVGDTVHACQDTNERWSGIVVITALENVFMDRPMYTGRLLIADFDEGKMNLGDTVKYSERQLEPWFRLDSDGYPIPPVVNA